jgi:hypothetical protein
VRAASLLGSAPQGEGGRMKRESGDQSALMVMRTDGQGMHAITPFSDFRPRFIDWGPVPSACLSPKSPERIGWT